MSHPYFHASGLVLGTVLAGFGINGLFRPAAHLQSLNFPAHPQNLEAHKLDRALMRIWGIRNVVVSFLIALIWRTGDEKLLGTALLGGGALAVVDGFVSRGLTGGGETQHWLFPPVIAVVSAGLHGWFDRSS